jgi:hypothetical protein
LHIEFNQLYYNKIYFYTNKIIKVPDIKLEGNKIDSRQCLRYTKVALVDIARRLRINLPQKLTKPILCDLIRNHRKMPAALMADIQKGKRLVSTKRQLAATKIQRAFKGLLARRRARARASSSSSSRSLNYGMPRVFIPINRNNRNLAARKIQKAFREKRAQLKVKSKKKKYAKHVKNIINRVKNMQRRGENVNVFKFNYGNQGIVENYLMSAARGGL